VSELLEWRSHDTSTETTFTEFGQYMVEEVAGDNFRIWLPDEAKNATIMSVGFASKDAARAACQGNLDGRRALETIEVLRRSEAAVAARFIAASRMTPPFHFDRYINGVLMAEGVTIEKEANLAAATKSAARLAPRGPKGETPVLVLVREGSEHQMEAVS
jgi:hypothetical protein